MAKANGASDGSRVRVKVRVKRTREKPKENPMEPKVPKAHTRAKHRKLVSSGLEHSKSEASSDTQESAMTCPADACWNDAWNCDEWNDGWSFDEWNDGWIFDEWNDDWSSVGWHEGWEQTYDTSASSFSLGGLDVSATSSPTRSEWVKMNLDIGAAVNTFPLNFGPEGAGDGRFYRTASGEWMRDGGAWQFQGYDKNGLLRSLSGRLTGVHKVLCSAAEIACKGRQDVYLGHDGGYMVPIHSKIGQGMRLVWKERTHSSLSRKQHSQFLPETRSEFDQHFEMR